MRLRRVKVVIIGIFSMVALAGCGQKEVVSEHVDSTQKKLVELTVSGAKEDQELLAEMIESFKENYKEQADFSIEVKEQAESETKNVAFEDLSKIADVFGFVDDQLMELAAAGVIDVIEDTKVIKAENSEASVQAASINDAVYAYPMTADNGYFMYYNKKYFSEKQVESLDEMLAVAASNKKKVTMDFGSGWYLYSFFGNTGLSLGLNDDGITNHCDWNSTNGEIKGADVGKAMLAIANNPGFSNQNDDGLTKGAKDGSVIAGISGVWSANALKKAWGDDYAAAKLPTYTCAGKQVQMASYAGYKMLGVNAYSENKEWARKLAEWITNEENQSLRFSKRGQGPSNNKAASSEEIMKSPAIVALLAQSEFSNLQRVGGAYWDPVADFGQKLAENKVKESDMQKLMDKMTKDITAKVTD